MSAVVRRPKIDQTHVAFQFLIASGITSDNFPAKRNENTVDSLNEMPNIRASSIQPSIAAFFLAATRARQCRGE